ncbi:GNAT family N-acetyltransferase [Candidatus Gracilibacteria bacterium]|nr:GNAT family N-acetyltransferase [Candidatus Gracilibacteria bacterium]
MRLFRRTYDLGLARVRCAQDTDKSAVSRLLRDGGRRYYALNGDDIDVLLHHGHVTVIEANGDLWGVGMLGRIVGQSTWLRALALEEGVPLGEAFALLLPAMQRAAAELGVTEIYCAGDETADVWLAPLLRAHGFSASTDVVVYEKREMSIPAFGNEAIMVRPARAADLTTILEVDRRCFEPQWTKDDTILGHAIAYGPYCMVAEVAGAVVGYAYATSHFGGRLVHLVRIAVLPERQGQAVGVRLLAEVVAYAESVGAYNLTLNTQAYNTGAQRLYRWFGFYPTGEQQTILVCQCAVEG